MVFKKLLLLVACSLFIFNSYGQANKMKFGKVEKEELEMTVYDQDTSASAVVLGDYTFTNFQFSIENGFEFLLDRHVRIKIFNKNGYQYADQNFAYYAPESGGSGEDLGSFKGYTYNLVGEEIEKIKLEKEGIFDETTDEYMKKKKITMPGVKEGSIIEFKYTLKSSFVRYLRDWVFQYDIPVLSSVYDLVIPEFLYYQVQQQGYVDLKNNSLNYKQESFPYYYWEQTRNGNEKFSGVLPSQSKVYKYEAENVPAFKTEPFMTTQSDYLGKVVFELQTVKYPNEVPRNMVDTWENLSKNLLESSSFGLAIKNSGFTKKVVEQLVTVDQTSSQKINAICSHLKNEMQWNGYTGKYSDRLKSAYEEKKASAQEINMILIAMLRDAKIEADPVILSTRDHGFVREHFPNLDQFNYVLCRAKLDGAYILLDATDPYLPNNLIPENCLNGRGWVVSEINPGWMKLSNDVKKSIKVSAQLKLSNSGELTGSVKQNYDGYYARNERKSILTEGEEKYKNELLDKSPWELDEVEILETKNTSQTLTISYSLEGEKDVEVMGNTIYLSPIFFLRESENAFKSEDRKYPVDFGCAEDKVYYAQIVLPDGYIIDEKPENAAFALPDNGGKFMYNITFQNNTLTIMSRLTINKSLFAQTEYPHLRQFFENIVAKHAQQIVLKKN